MRIVFWLESLKGRDNYKDLGVDGMIVLERNLVKYSGRVWIGFIWLRTGAIGGLL
jgi:hypothetical protein